MKARDFDYACPCTLNEALALLSGSDREALPLAGGQSLMPMMNFRLATPDLLVDLNQIVELKGISEENGAINIGAMTRYNDLHGSNLVEDHLPLLTKALPFIAHPAIRNRGTIGGSIALADPAAEMPALLLALDASITVVSEKGERSIAADQFFRGLYDTALGTDEIVKSVSVPKSGRRSHGFAELARRHGDYAMAGMAATAKRTEPFEDLRLAFFGIADRALRAVDAERCLNGHSLNDETAMKAAEETLAALPFHGDLQASAAMKHHLASVVMKRILRTL